MHIYAFGSICRGDISQTSDVDLLAIVDGFDSRFDQNLYSIYSYKRINDIWSEGNPFAWHLSMESRLIHASDGVDIIKGMGNPATYSKCREDCEKFYALFQEAVSSFSEGKPSKIFDISMVFLAIRNFATCFSLGYLEHPNFSRHSAINISPCSLSILEEAYAVLERARILCTRAHGTLISNEDAALAASQFNVIDAWMKRLLLEVIGNGARV